MEGSYQTDGFQSSASFNSRVLAEGFTFTPPSNASMNRHTPCANAIPMNNTQTGNGWEQELFQGNNIGMPTMISRPLFLSPVGCSQLPKPSFRNHPAYSSLHGQAAPLRVPHNTPYPSSRNLYADDAIALGHRTQPESQSRSESLPGKATQPTPFSSIHFQSAKEACDYLNETVWYPSMGNYGIPQTDRQYRFYLLKLCKALQNTTDVWDAGSTPWNYNKFLQGPLGECTKPKDIEAVAHMVLHNTIKVHKMGVTNLAHRRSVDYMPCNREDTEFTFPQRIHFLAELLAHSKTAAAEVMQMMNVEKYIAIPITMLRLFTSFDQRWKGTVGLEKWQWLELEPYNGTGVAHPTIAEQKVLRDMTARRQICDEGTLMNHVARTPVHTAATPMQQLPVLYSDSRIAGGKRPATGSPEQEDKETPKRVRLRRMLISLRFCSPQQEQNGLVTNLKDSPTTINQEVQDERVQFQCTRRSNGYQCKSEGLKPSVAQIDPIKLALDAILESGPLAFNFGASDFHDPTGGASSSSAQPKPLPKFTASVFETPRGAAEYLNEAVWRPTSCEIGIPTCSEEYLAYVKKIYDALIDISDVWDADRFPRLIADFAEGGRWSNQQDLDAIAQFTVYMVMKLHRNGTTGLAFLREPVMSLHEYDVGANIAQRLHFIAYLLRHMKSVADLFMQQVGVEVTCNRIWSVLNAHRPFTACWASLSWSERNHFVFKEPYVGTMLHFNPPPPSRPARGPNKRTANESFLESPGLLSKRRKERDWIGALPHRTVPIGETTTRQQTLGTNEATSQNVSSYEDLPDIPDLPFDDFWASLGMDTAAAGTQGNVGGEEGTEAFPERLFEMAEEEAG
ncbi:hypothetical protein TW65_08065 [Stemphylium lycopersici]|nr:hypothetical protein TW65_08065 [Stemphylium lycopersici]